jgi:oligopeptide/dipeptide ABC transporter ATP-binding protein
MSLLALEGVALEVPVRFGTRQILKDVSLEVAEGEALGLVGESGSGKSMTLRAVLGTVPDGSSVGGALRFGDMDLRAPDSARRRRQRGLQIGVIGQDPRSALNPVRTIESFVTEALIDVMGQPRDVARHNVMGLLRMVGLDDIQRVLRSYPHQLSGGMLQRVCIAAALATGPRLLLADEPTTALDVTTQSEVMAIIDALRRDEGMAMVFVTHDLALAAAVCDRIAVMYAGEIVEVASPTQMWANPRHPYTRLLIDARPSIDATARRLSVVPGRPAAAHEITRGCAFVGRCPWAETACESTGITLQRVNGGSVRCRRVEQIAAQLATTRVVDSLD